jgi:CMP-N-acetylneuraminic acid synthetase
MKTNHEGDRTEVLAVIPMRSELAGTFKRGVQLAKERRLLSGAIEQARAARRVTRIVVTTDSEAIACWAWEHGVEAPCPAPPDAPEGFRTDLDFVLRILRWLKAREGYVPDTCVHFPPTESPCLGRDIDEMVEILESDSSLDSVTAVCRAPRIHGGARYRDESGRLYHCSPARRRAVAVAAPRRIESVSYQPTGAVSVVRTRVIRAMHSLAGSSIHGYVLGPAACPPARCDPPRAARRWVVAASAPVGPSPFFRVAGGWIAAARDRMPPGGHGVLLTH